MPLEIEYAFVALATVSISGTPRFVGPTTGLTFDLVLTSPNNTVPVGGELALTSETPIFGFDLDSSPATFIGTGADGGALVQLVSDGTYFYVTDTAYPLVLPGITSIPGPFDYATPLCFAEGTMIATDTGLMAVESLRAGDRVRTADGGSAEVRWIGRQTQSTVFGNAEDVCPVRIRAGALAEGVPARDLTVTSDHGIVFDEAIVHAAALVNGTSIQRVPRDELAQKVTYYHIETEGHAVVLAEGCPAETFIDNASRERFANFAEFAEQFGADQPEMEPLGLPRAKGARQVPPAIRDRIAARAAVLAEADGLAQAV